MEYTRKTVLTLAACTEICYENVSSRQTSHRSGKVWSRGARVSQVLYIRASPRNRETHLCFPHDLAPGTDPRNEDEFLTLRLLIVRIRDTDICEGAFSDI